MIKGTLIKESLSDDTILDLVSINDVEIWTADNHTENQPKYWTALFFSVVSNDFLLSLSKSLKTGWYVDLSNEENKIIVLSDKIIKYSIGDAEGKRKAVEYCKEAGIPLSQIDW